MRERKRGKKWERTGREGTVKSTSLSVRVKINPGKFLKNIFGIKRIRERGGGGRRERGREREIERERGGEGWVGHLFQRYK